MSAKIDIAPDGCHLWTGYVHRTGYGRVAYHGKVREAHRVAYELAHGPVPKGKEIDHLCRVRRCVNPDHLEAVTRKVNCLRGAAPTIKIYFSGACRRGHPKTAEHGVRKRNGNWRCMTCHRATMIVWRAKRREAVTA